jgi:D-glycero-D-manno-heptose 1,7-bisphosphate phosphatase
VGKRSLRGAILDRDGTLIDVVRDEETGFVGVAFHPSHVRLLPGAVEGLLALRDAGFVFAIATNQPAPAKGQFSVEAVERTNTAVVERLAAEGIEVKSLQVCMHHPTVSPCTCRKPAPDLLTRAAADMGVAIGDCWMIGDSTSDVAAARAAGARSALVFDTRRCELCPLRNGPVGDLPDVRGATIAECAARILGAAV